MFFEENGQERQRVIMLPGSTDNGREEYERSRAVMRAAGLLDNG